MVKSVFFIILINISLCFASSNTLDKSFENSNKSFFKSDDFYFITGDPNTKVNFAFGMDISKKYNIDFIFNQTMFWELEKDSKPFRDINYNPKIRKHFDFKNFQFDLGLWEHHSNGRDGLESRSYDSSYVFVKYFSRFEDIKLYTGLKLRGFFRVDDENDDIEKLIGHLEFTSSFQYLLSDGGESVHLNIALGPGGDYRDLFRFGYQKVDIIFDPNWSDSTIKLHAQIYRGYGESLLDYNLKDSSYRIGLSL